MKWHSSLFAQDKFTLFAYPPRTLSFVLIPNQYQLQTSIIF